MKRLALLLAFAGAACASTERPDIGRFVDQTLREVPVMPSIGLGGVKGGRVIYLGEANTGFHHRPAAEAYTGLACAILAQRGQLDLDAPITKYLPEVALAKAP